MRKKYEPLYIKAFDRHLHALQQSTDNLSNRQMFYKTILYAVRYYNAAKERYSSKDELEVLLSEYADLFIYMKCLTPLELTRLFPIDKRYDGDRWQTKDYFYTMNELNHIGMDNPIGEDLIPLMMDYCNNEILTLIVRHTTLVSALMRYNGQEGIAEQWIDAIGLDSYISEVDEDTGETCLISRNALKYLFAALGQ